MAEPPQGEKAGYASQSGHNSRGAIATQAAGSYVSAEEEHTDTPDTSIIRFDRGITAVWDTSLLSAAQMASRARYQAASRLLGAVVAGAQGGGLIVAEEIPLWMASIAAAGSSFSPPSAAWVPPAPTTIPPPGVEMCPPWWRAVLALTRPKGYIDMQFSSVGTHDSPSGCYRRASLCLPPDVRGSGASAGELPPGAGVDTQDSRSNANADRVLVTLDRARALSDVGAAMRAQLLGACPHPARSMRAQLLGACPHPARSTATARSTGPRLRTGAFIRYIVGRRQGALHERAREGSRRPHSSLPFVPLPLLLGSGECRRLLAPAEEDLRAALHPLQRCLASARRRQLGSAWFRLIPPPWHFVHAQRRSPPQPMEERPSAWAFLAWRDWWFRRRRGAVCLAEALHQRVFRWEREAFDRLRGAAEERRRAMEAAAKRFRHIGGWARRRDGFRRLKLWWWWRTHARPMLPSWTRALREWRQRRAWEGLREALARRRRRLARLAALRCLLRWKRYMRGLAKLRSVLARVFGVGLRRWMFRRWRRRARELARERRERSRMFLEDERSARVEREGRAVHWIIRWWRGLAWEEAVPLLREELPPAPVQVETEPRLGLCECVIEAGLRVPCAWHTAYPRDAPWVRLTRSSAGGSSGHEGSQGGKRRLRADRLAAMRQSQLAHSARVRGAHLLRLKREVLVARGFKTDRGSAGPGGASAGPLDRESACSLGLLGEEGGLLPGRGWRWMREMGREDEDDVPLQPRGNKEEDEEDECHVDHVPWMGKGALPPAGIIRSPTGGQGTADSLGTTGGQGAADSLGTQTLSDALRVSRESGAGLVQQIESKSSAGTGARTRSKEQQGRRLAARASSLRAEDAEGRLAVSALGRWGHAPLWWGAALPRGCDECEPSTGSDVTSARSSTSGRVKMHAISSEALSQQRPKTVGYASGPASGSGSGSSTRHPRRPKRPFHSYQPPALRCSRGDHLARRLQAARELVDRAGGRSMSSVGAVEGRASRSRRRGYR